MAGGAQNKFLTQMFRDPKVYESMPNRERVFNQALELE